MKPIAFLFAILFFVILLLPSFGRPVNAQSRDYHTQRVVLDDGNGHTTTLQAGGANGTFTPPVNTSNAGDVIASDGAGGSTWQAPSAAASGVPSGTLIMNTSATTPTGYTLLSGPTIVAGGSAWVSKTAVPTYRNAPMIGTINGKIYVVGGYAASLAVLSTMDVYDPVTDSWSVDATSGTFTGRAEGTAAVVGGKLYVLCGSKNPGNSADNQVYDPVAKTWTAKAPAPGGRYEALAEVSGNYIYLMGGGNGSNLLNNDVYDVVNDNWNVTKTATSLPASMGLATSANVNGKFYLISSAFRSYDPSTNAWTTLSTTNYTTRQAPTAASVNGKFYVMGGSVNSGPPNFFSSNTSTTEIYDPSVSAWSPGISSGLTGQYGGRSAVVNGTIYMMCGQNSGTLNEALTTGTSIYYYVKN